MQICAVCRGIVRFHEKNCTRFWPRRQEVIVQFMGNTFTRPLLRHHNLRKTECSVAVFAGEVRFRFSEQPFPPPATLSERPSPCLPDSSCPPVGDHQIEARLGGVGIEPVHKCFNAVERIAACDGVNVRTNIYNLDRVSKVPSLSCAVATEGDLAPSCGRVGLPPVHSARSPILRS
jgi:hypothetical protein